uniref:Uncharacterized protein n=1 Tax=Amphimedon queenslandica TaxID=400682 RepID=A0A1X7SYL5_AMPQE
MTTKEIEQPTKKRVNNYEDMERDLLSMKQQLAEKEKQVQELMKEKDQPDEIEIEFDIMHEKLSSLLDSLPVLKKKHKEDKEESRRKIEKLEHLVAEKDKKLEQLSQSVAELQMQRKMNKALILENERFKSNIKEKEDRIADLEHCLQDLQQIKHEITQIGSVPGMLKYKLLLYYFF